MSSARCEECGEIFEKFSIFDDNICHDCLDDDDEYDIDAED